MSKGEIAMKPVEGQFGVAPAIPRPRDRQVAGQSRLYLKLAPEPRARNFGIGK
jgi:hypothetical protein